jgi:hypothetical protein
MGQKVAKHICLLINKRHLFTTGGSLSPQLFTVYGTADADNTPFLIYPISLAQQAG